MESGWITHDTETRQTSTRSIIIPTNVTSIYDMKGLGEDITKKLIKPIMEKQNVKSSHQ